MKIPFFSGRDQINLLKSSFKVQNPSDLCLVSLVGLIYLRGKEKQRSSVFREHQTGADTSEKPLQIKVPQKGHQNKFTKKKGQKENRTVLHMI